MKILTRNLYFGKVVRKLAYHLTVFSEKYNPRPAQLAGNEEVLEAFVARCRKMHKPRVLELGTKRSIPDRPTIRKDWVPNASEYLGSDIEAGDDVDIVVDAHRLTQVVGEKQFDVIISCSTFEHFKYPHLVAFEIMKALKIGGVLFIQTHQTFPLHAYPYDYFRFSREALEGIFGTKMGFHVIGTQYKIPVSLYSPHALDRDCPAFINVELYDEKNGETPDEYIYEFDCNV
ncbi:MAG: methyltransferase domain-containing protein [Candidatus Helarchaeota archaeon]